MKERKNFILDSIKEQKTKTQSNNFSYNCLRCGLTLSFDRNQTRVVCPNDGNFMYRTK